MMAGNETAPMHGMPGIWAFLNALPKGERPTLLRGDVAYGSESILHEAEARGQPYLTKLRLTKNVKGLIRKLFHSNSWEGAGQGWEGLEDTLKLAGWSRGRRLVVLRRKLTGEMLMSGKDKDQGELAFVVGERRYAMSTPAGHLGAVRDPHPGTALS